MLDAIDANFPEEVAYTRPEGGMFLWGELPNQLSAMDLFERAVKKKVVFVPGDPFYTTSQRTSTFRLNFSCVDETLVQEGIVRLGEAIKEMIH